jgi:hypothetical protein
MSLPQEPVDGIESIRWNVRLLDQRPTAVYAIVAVALIAAIVGFWLMHSPFMGCLGFAMILGSTVDYWYGARFLLDRNRAQARIGASLSSMSWDQVKRVVVSKNSVKLTPLAGASPLDPFRGVRLMTTQDNREQVLSFVRGHVPEGADFQSIASDSF